MAVSEPLPRSAWKRRVFWLVLVAACAAAAILLYGSRSQAPEVSSGPGPPTGIPGKVLFDGDFARGLEPWLTRIHAERISVVDDPILGPKRRVAQFTVYDGDVGPTDNPRAQIESPEILTPGGDYWVGWSTLFPADFPVLPSGGWLTLESIYGPPSDDAGPLATSLAGDELRFQRNETYGYDVPWRIPLIRGRWIDFAYYFKLSKDEDEGFVELYLNTGEGWRRQMLLGQPRLHMQTLDSSNGAGPNSFRVNNYRKRGMFEVATLYHASPKIGTSFDAVAPKSY